jgi:hypothetical protein
MRGESLPLTLAAYVSEILLKKFVEHQRKRGGDPYANAWRDIFVVYAVRHLELRGIKATRGKDKHGSRDKRLSGCAIVADVLGENEGAFEDVWKARAKFGIQ